MGQKNILIVEDDPDVALTVGRALSEEGYQCTQAGSGTAALAEVMRQRPDLILLDRVLPGVSGDDVLRELKGNPATADIPIIMLTGKGDEADELVGLALGADDYIAKPFSHKRLCARVEALLRRGVTARPKPGSGDVPTREAIRINGTSYGLSDREHLLITTLVAAQGFLLEGEHLAKIVLGENEDVGDEDIRPLVDALRGKLGPAGEWIQQIVGKGYVFCAPPGTRIEIMRRSPKRRPAAHHPR
ncbi:MAG: response regulator transcription factor [Phycisphaerae bacterium]|nr:response regulator transcription factor [Phycisphaerae bacterium]